MNKSNSFSLEVPDRAVRMVLEHRKQYPSLWAATQSIAPKTGCVPHTLYEWIRRHEVDSGTRDGVTTAESDRIKALHARQPERDSLIHHSDRGSQYLSIR
jgi:transposase